MAGTRRPWIVLAATIALALALQAGVARVSWVVPAAAALGLLAAFDSGMLSTGRHRLRLSLLVAGTLALQVAGEAWGVGQDWTYLVGWGISYCLLGWAAMLAVLALPSDAAQEPQRDPPLLWRVVGLLLVLGGLALVHVAIRDRYVVTADGVLYLLQASLLQSGALGRPVHPDLLPALQPMLSFIGQHGLTGQYPPGWPLLLALFGAVDLRWWAGVAAGVVGVVFTYRLGARLRSPAVGFLAASVLATGGVFVVLSGTYLAHVPTLALCVTAAYLMLPQGPERRASVPAWAVAGLLLGWAVAMRPLTGVALGAGIWWWSLLKLRRGEVVRGTLALIAGGVLPMAGLLAYNAGTTGHPFRFGYQMAGLQQLGFGVRGFGRFTGTGLPWFESRQFGPLDSLRNLLSMTADAARNFGPAGAILPLALLAGPLGARPSLRRVAPFLLLPAAYTLYFWKDVRFYTELLPFVALGVALVIDDVRRVSRSRARALVILFLGGQLALTALRVGHSATTFRRTSLPYLQAVAAAARTDSVLVLVDDPDRDGILFSTLWLFDVGPFPGRAVVARDTHDGNVALLRAFPGRKVLRLYGRDPQRPSVPRLVPLGESPSR